ncbi:MAG: alpha-L-arabinofuranosidase [Bryobacteraceae bacterium]|nr:alpha-L-arabinofuranosidase [Bryobacteraceae bacterium]
MTGRREFLKRSSIGAAASAIAAAQAAGPGQVVIEPTPVFDISPYLYMQFMEPLGTNDGSVEAAWDYRADDWLGSFVDAVKDLAPDVIRFGGIFASFNKWREAVGPVASRPWMYNYLWGGKETNRVGTHEFVDLCRRVGAEPLYCVNFLGDGRPEYRKAWDGSDRTGDANEAADWVAYANDPDNKERKSHGVAEPYNIKLWQIGNETSYSKTGFGKDEAVRHTIEFAQKMRARDRSIKLIGWGDWGNGPGGRELWAGDMAKRAGDQLDYIAFHMMGQGPSRKDSVLRSYQYRKFPERAWEELLEMGPKVQARVKEMEDAVGAVTPKLKLAITEGHMGLFRSSMLTHEWLTGVYHARIFNIYQRHGGMVKIATNADFEGTRWASNAVMISGRLTYLMPVASVMRLFKRVNGKQAVTVKSCPAELDIAASRTGDRVYLHVANTSYSRAVEASFSVQGRAIGRGTVHEIAPEDPMETVCEATPDVFKPKEKAIGAGPVMKWSFPARSVSAVELELTA